MKSPSIHTSEMTRPARARLLSLPLRWAELLQPKGVASQSRSGRPDAVICDDEFQRARQPYEAIQTVTPVLTDDLNREIQTAIQRYEAETGRLIPPAYRYPKPDFPGQWASNKAERITPVVWVLSQLPPAARADEAMNQLAAVLHHVDGLAHRRFGQVAHLYLPDTRPLRLTVPLPETVQQQCILVSLGIGHVTLFKADGAIQIQCLPSQPAKLDYLKQAQSPDRVLCTKPGLLGVAFWL